MKKTILFFAPLIAFFLVSTVVAQRLEGFVDMHTHPKSHLGFGGMILYGAPDIGSLLLKGQKYRGWHIGQKNCNIVEERVRAIEDALGNDNAMHGGPGFGTTTFVDANNCGDLIRTAIIDKLEEKYIHEYPNPGLLGQVKDHPHAGYPAFVHWPHWSSVTHQQMWVDWIKRAVEVGGLRVMVALAVNNSLLAKAANATQYVDDKSSVELQLTEMQGFVDRHSFMEVAKTPTDLRRIVQSNRLAVILGVETDDFGNLTRRASFGGERITQSIVNAEIRRLYDEFNVRYIVPIHFSNTVLGGYAITRDLFSLSSKEYANSFAGLRETCDEGIHFKLTRVNFDLIEANLLRTRDLGRIIDAQPNYTPPSPGCGHANRLGLTPLGQGALQTMMNLGMMIDIDHMSRLAADETLTLAEARNYPINSGHNGLQGDECISGRGSNLQHCTENQRTVTQYEKIRNLGGMIGLGHGEQATSFVRNYQTVLELMGNRPVAIGTDVNGLEALPHPDPQAPVRYNASFPKYRFGSRSWDFNVDGFAHYGLFPDYIRSWQSSTNPATRMTDRAMDAFMSSAEGFARMWEKSILRSVGAPRTASLSITTNWCTHSGATLLMGDFSGDTSVDLLCRDPGRLSIDYADNRGLLAGTTDWFLDTAFCTHRGATLHLGDFNGDGRTDLLCHDPGRLWIDYADNRGNFTGSPDWFLDTTFCTHAGATLHLGDFNGDGRTDLLCRDRSRLWIDYADNRGNFTGSPDWFLDTAFCTQRGATLHLADFNGDGQTDLLCRDSTRLLINYANTNSQFER